MIYALDRNFPDITKDDLQDLIGSKAYESKNIDYKIDFNLSQDQEKKELCKDICSFTNNEGGYIIYGIKEEESYPVEIVGIELEIDKTKQQINSIVHDGIKPKIQIEIKEVEVGEGKYCLVLKIFRSYNKPHQVIYNKEFRFFYRNSNGTKDTMDIGQIRDQILAPDKLRREIDNFRRKRLIEVRNYFPISLEKKPFVLIHIIPLDSFLKKITIDLKEYDIRKYNYNKLSPLFSDYPENQKYNFEGKYIYNGDSNSPRTYLQLFRNGCIESVGSSRDGFDYGNKEISMNYVEKKIFEFFNKNSKFIHEDIGIKVPYLLFILIENIFEYSHPIDGLRFNSKQKISKNNLNFPEIYLEEIPKDVSLLLKPTFDMLANELGYPESPSYKNGKWEEIK